MLVRSEELAPQVAQVVDAHLVWMDEQPLTIGKEYTFKLAGKAVFGRVERIQHRIDVNSLAESQADSLQLNEIALVRIAFNAPVVFDAYTQCRGTGSLIVIDRLSNATAAAGMVVAAAGSAEAAPRDELAHFKAFEVELNALVRKFFPHWEAKDISQLLK
jgi:sulfate adenylyltransferase subunit 1